MREGEKHSDRKSDLNHNDENIVNPDTTAHA